MESAFGPPNADSARQAIHAIRGYEYQILAAALAWVDLEENGLIYLEVAEDYAHVIGGDIEAVQVKATRGSGAVTLNTPAVRDAIESFVDLVAQNPARQMHLRFLTTAPIGLEKSPDDRLGEIPGLKYWERARADREHVGPLRATAYDDKPHYLYAPLGADPPKKYRWKSGRYGESTPHVAQGAQYEA